LQLSYQLRDRGKLLARGATGVECIQD
jgi:hypothetical protein